MQRLFDILSALNCCCRNSATGEWILGERELTSFSRISKHRIEAGRSWLERIFSNRSSKRWTFIDSSRIFADFSSIDRSRSGTLAWTEVLTWDFAGSEYFDNKVDDRRHWWHADKEQPNFARRTKIEHEFDCNCLAFWSETEGQSRLMISKFSGRPMDSNKFLAPSKSIPEHT